MDGTERQVKLGADLGSSALFSLAFGSIVGVSWVILVGAWIVSAGPMGAMLAFIIGGALILPVGACYARLGQSYPATGGEFVYAYRFFGQGMAFATAWMLALFYVSVCAFEAVSIAWIVSAIWPGALGPELYSIGGTPLHAGDLAVGALFAVALCLLQLQGAQIAARIQDAMVLAMIVLAVAFLVAAIWNGSAARLSPGFGIGFQGFLPLLLVTPLFFAGFGSIPQALGESSASARARLPLIITAVILASMLFYTGVILASALVLSPDEAATAEMPAAVAFERAFGSRYLAIAALVTGLLGLLTTWNAVLFSAARVLYALGHARLGPIWLAHTGGRSSPVAATLVVTGITMATLPFGKSLLTPVISLGGLIVTGMYGLVAASLWRARSDSPAEGKRLLPGIGLAISAGLVLLTLRELAGKSIEFGVVAGWGLLGLLVWRASFGTRNSLTMEERTKRVMGS